MGSMYDIELQKERIGRPFYRVPGRAHGECACCGAQRQQTKNKSAFFLVGYGIFLSKLLNFRLLISHSTDKLPANFKGATSVFAIIEAAGWPIWPIILASVIALAIIGERLWSLRTSMVMPKNLLPQVVHEYRQNGLTPQLLSRLTGGPALGQVFAAGLKNIKSPPAVVKEAIEEAGQSVS